MQLSYSTESTPGRVNEDHVVCGVGWAAILDGATAPAGLDSGCVHDVPWLVRHLAAALADHLILDTAPLSDLLAAAIEETCRAHVNTCDLENPDSPSSTISIVRARNAILEYLALGDSPIILRGSDQVYTPIIDDRTAHLPGGRPYTAELVSSLRNKPDGFWVASTDPKAAYHAVTGSVELSSNVEVAMLTDGVTRLVDWYGFDWSDLFSILNDEGPSGLISRVRSAEKESPPSFGKQHDDATAVYIRKI